MPWVTELFASGETAVERMGICTECPDLTKMKLCTNCGCLMPAKVRLSKSTCPLGKWGAVATQAEHFIDDSVWNEQEAAHDEAHNQFKYAPPRKKQQIIR